MSKLRLIELFAGYGSQAMALKRIGIDFEHYKVVEFDKYAIRSYNAVHGTNFDTADINDIHAQDLEIVDTDKYNYLMTYSFPCTDLSRAGKMEGMSKESSTRSGLLWQVERILNECKELPQFLLMENVPQVHGKKNINDFADWISFLESKGYISKWQDLNAKDYGVAQNRDRCFMVSYLDNESKFKFPEPFTLTKTIKDYLEDQVSERYYLKEQTINALLKHKERNKLKGNGFGARFVNKTDIASTILTSPNKSPGQYLKIKHKIPGELIIRKLTPLECFRLMGVSDADARKMLAVNSDTQCYKQAGNSIVVDVMVEIFRNLFLGGSEQLSGQMDIYDILN